MNANFGLVRSLDKKVKGGKKARNEYIANRALDYVREMTGKPVDDEAKGEEQ